MVTKTTILATIVAIGAAIRIYHLDYNPLWLDEAATLTISSQPVQEILTSVLRGEPNPPLFYLIEHAILSFGNTEFILRFLPAIFGILLIPVMFLVGKEFYDSNTGLIAAAITAFSPLMVVYSQEARAYSLLLLVIALAFFFYLKALKTGSGRDWAMVFLLIGLAIWVHYIAMIFAASVVVHLIVETIRSRKTLPHDAIRNGMILTMVMISPIIVWSFYSGGIRTATFGMSGISIIYEAGYQILGFNPLSVSMVGIFSVIGMYRAWKIADRNYQILVPVVVVFSIIATSVGSFSSPLEPRYLMFLAIPVYTAVSISYTAFLSENTTKITSDATAMVLLVAVLVISAPQIVAFNSGYIKEDWRGVSENLTLTTNPGDVVVVMPSYLASPLNYYYSNTSDETIEYGADTIADLENVPRTQGSTYYVLTADILSTENAHTAETWINTTEKQEISVKGITVLKNKRE